MTERPDVHALVEQLLDGATPEETAALIAGLSSGPISSDFEELDHIEMPELGPVPAEVREFRVRLDLLWIEPSVWRRLELRGDLTLARLHDVIQAAMGWTNSHLHRFRTGGDHRSPYFLTHLDLDEGDEGMLEDDVRLDQLLAQTGDELWYDYDFGDGWEHRLVVEEVGAAGEAPARCLGGEMACPPEDCGGPHGYAELAAWVRSGYDDALLPQVFEDASQARQWLPLNWHPDRFDVEETDATLAVVTAEPVEVIGELAELAAKFDRVGIRLLREVLARPLSHEPVEVSDAEAARLTETYRTFLDVVGDGVALTSAGYLPPKVVEELAARTGISDWWFGKANREDHTRPVARIRDTARSLGLVSVRKGRLSPTAAAVRCGQDPQALWRHITGRLPVGTKDAGRQAGFMALAVVGSGAPASEWRSQISDLLYALGWRSGYDGYSPPPANSDTLDVLQELGGAARVHWGELEGVDPALAATARAVIRGD